MPLQLKASRATLLSVLFSVYTQKHIKEMLFRCISCVVLLVPPPPPCSHLRLCCLRSSLLYHLCNHSSVIDWRTKMDSCWENCDWWIAISRWFPCRWIRASRLCHWDSVGRIYCGHLYPPLWILTPTRHDKAEFIRTRCCLERPGAGKHAHSYWRKALLRVADKQRNKCTGSANDPHSIRGKKWTFLLINQVPLPGRVGITSMGFVSSINQCFGIVIVFKLRLL